MVGKRFGIGLGIALAVLAVAIGVTAGVAGTAEQPAWQQALHARSDGLNREYGLGKYARGTHASGSDWLHALAVRSDALNRKYALGKYASGTPETSSSDWLHALAVRSDALNREYGLGTYAPARQARAVAAAGKVTVRIAFTNDGREETDGSVAGTGRFTATGAIADKGTVLIYRTVKGARITLRYVTAGKKGTIAFVVTIDTSRGTSTWTIASGTKAYKGLHGKGTETENPPQYTRSTLTGTVWR